MINLNMIDFKTLLTNYFELVSTAQYFTLRDVIGYQSSWCLSISESV